MLPLGVVGAAVYLVFAALGSKTIYADPDDEELVILGRKTYDTHCASCHGLELEGQPNWREPLPTGGLPAPPHDDSGHTWHHPDSLLFEITKSGGQPYSPPDFKSNMPGFDETLDDREILAVLAYIKTRWSREVRATQRRINNAQQ